MAITIWYILPVRSIAFYNAEISLTCPEKDIEDPNDIKKEKTKEFITAINDRNISFGTIKAKYNILPLSLASFYSLVETPPPDFI